MTGYFTGENRIGTLAVVEVGEQIFTMAVTLACLFFFAGTDPGISCKCVIFGSSMGSCLTLGVLRFLYRAEKNPRGPDIPVRGRILRAAVPLALADTLKSGISTLENLMVPKRLSLAIHDPLAAFGRISGMVFPVMMFPACILFGLSELLIPELARCSCSGGETRIHYLLHKSLRVAMLYGAAFAGILYLSADSLCLVLYKSEEAGALLRQYAPLVPMLYCDAITDAITKGNYSEALGILSELFRMREPAQKIIFSVSASMRQLLFARIALEAGKTPGYLMENFGVRYDFQAKNLMAGAKRTDISKCRATVLLCAEAAFAINSGADPEESLSELVASICFNKGVTHHA